MAKKLNHRQARWSLYLAYCPEYSIRKPDTLLQRPDHGKGASDNEDVVLLRLELLAVRALEGVQLEGPERDILKEIRQGNQKGDQEELVAKAARELWQASSKMVHSAVMGIKRFDHRTKMKARSERQNLQTASQLCTKQVGTGEINQIIESLLKVKVQRITKTY